MLVRAVTFRIFAFLQYLGIILLVVEALDILLVFLTKDISGLAVKGLTYLITQIFPF